MSLSSLTLLIADLAPSHEGAMDALLAAKAPALTRIMRAAQARASDLNDDLWHPALPHERWLCHPFTGSANAAPLPLGSFLYRADFPHAPEADLAQTWYCMQLVHLQANRDHLVLLPTTALAIEPEESAALLETALPVLQEISRHLRCTHPYRWYVGAEHLPDLITSSPERATGRNIDTWMPRNLADAPRHDIARRWRKWQNEIQMMWYDHPVNLRRRQNGALTINSLWLYGGGTLGLPLTSPTVAACPSHCFSLNQSSALLQGIARHTGARYQNIQTLAEAEGNALVFVNTLSEAALQADWHTWLATLAQLEQDCFAPLEQALREKRLPKAQLIACSEHRWQSWTLHRPAPWKWWQRQTLSQRLAGLHPSNAL